MNLLVERVGWTLVHSLWEGTLVWAGLKLVLLALRRRSAQSRYVAGCGALALATIGPWVTFWNLNGGVIMRPLRAANLRPSSSGRLTLDAPALPAGLDFHLWLVYLEQSLAAALPWLVVAWMMGCAWASLRLLVDWKATRRLATAPSLPLSETIQHRCRALAAQLGIVRAVRLGESLLVEVPSVVGWLKPVILVPAGAFVGLSASQVDALLGHELAHVLRQDFLINLLQSIADVVFFYHPAVRAINRGIRSERENACDDIAVALTGDPVGYAAALARLEETRHPALLLAATGDGTLLGRIRRLVGRPARRPGPVPNLAWMAGTGLCLYLAVVMATPTVMAQLGSAKRSAGPAQPNPAAATGLSLVGMPPAGAPQSARSTPARTINFEAMAALEVMKPTVVVTSTQVVDRSIRSEFDLQTFKQDLESEKVRQRVLASYSPAELGLLQQSSAKAPVAHDALGVTTFECDSANRVIYIFTRHPNPAAAALIANRYASEFVAYLTESMSGMNNYAVKYLEERAEQLRKDSETAARALASLPPTSSDSGTDSSVADRRKSLQQAADAARANYQTILARLQQTKDIMSKARIPVQQIVVASAPAE